MEDILTSLVPSLAERGVFGPGHYMSLKSDGDTTDHRFSSEVTLLKVKMKVHGCDFKYVPIVVKSQFCDERFRRRRDLASMFKNEVAMYFTILPFLNASEHKPYPNVHYGVAGGGRSSEDVLIVENIKYCGYTKCKNDIILDYNHIVVALRRLAELHSWSFVKKVEDKKKFFELVGNLEKIVRVRRDEDFDFDQMNYLSLKRGIDPILKSENGHQVLKDFLKVARNIRKLSDAVCEVDDRFGIIVHGDYSNFNLLFKYDYKGKPVDCAYFDFQLSKYSSPAVDISFFLYLHTTPEMRDEHWDGFLRLYWDSVRESVPADIGLPTFEDFQEHFASKAMYGYIVCSFYLPSILEENVITDEEYLMLSTDEKLQRFVNSAGAKGQNSISKIVEHMLEKNYIHKFMRYHVKK